MSKSSTSKLQKAIVPILAIVTYAYHIYHYDHVIAKTIGLLMFTFIWSFRVQIFTKEHLKQYGPPALAMLIFAIKGFQNRYIDLTSAGLIIFTFLWLLIGAAKYLNEK